MDDHGYRVGLWLGKSPVARAIQTWTRSPYSHAGFLTTEREVIEAVGTGMRIRPLNDDPKRVHWFDVEGFDSAGWQIAEEFLRTTVHRGTGYNYPGLFAFALKYRARRHDVLFCSQAVFAAVRLGGVELLSRCSEDLVSPALLGFSPKLIYKPL